MTFSTLDSVVAALPGQRLDYRKFSTSQGIAGLWDSSYNMTGGLPATASTPAPGLTGEVPTSATVGAFPFVNPGSGALYLARLTGAIGASTVSRCTMAVYDRLWQNSGINVTSTSPQTINSIALTRPDANGANAEVWWQVYSAMGAGTPTITLAYTDQDGNTETTGSSGVLTTTMAVRKTGQFALAAGDTGVRSVQTWTADSSFTSGIINLVIRRCVTMFETEPDGRLMTLDMIALGLPRVYNSACLELLFLPHANMTFDSGFSLYLVNG